MHFFITIAFTIFLTASLQAGDLPANINYGDSRDEVMEKLMKSSAFTSSVSPSLFTRLGLNGSFESTKDINGLKFKLYFDWIRNEGLTEINYRSSDLPESEYSNSLMKHWRYTINLLSAIHGRAAKAGPYPKKSDVTEGKIIYSHEWRTDEGFIYLGVGMINGKYCTSISFTKYIRTEGN